MTREEAIKNIREHCYFASLLPQAKEALEMAIKALEQEPCEDCISRQAILDKCENTTCFECKHFKRLKDGQRGSIKGSCKLKCSDSYRDWRYGRQKACKTYFEAKEVKQ